MRGQRYWFPTRQSGGIGWGLPFGWQGWVVLGVYDLAITAFLVGLLLPTGHAVRVVSILGLIGSTLILFLVVFVTSEPIRKTSEKE